jgi:hypothetical protein
MAAEVIWVIDTSSVIAIRRSIENSNRAQVFARMTALVQVGRLVFARQVLEELERAADPKSPDAQYKWAKENKGKACELAPTLDEVKDILRVVPTVLDPDKDTGVEEADPYVLALAARLRSEQREARVVTEESKDYPRKMSLSTASGLLGIPSVPLLAFLRFEQIL